MPGLGGGNVTVAGLVSTAYELIGLVRDLQRGKREREEHAQQLVHDLQRCQVTRCVDDYGLHGTSNKENISKIFFCQLFKITNDQQ